ncbi:MAG: DUF3883 domain-containing protein [Oscillospiraceae bacterium]|nr:DUF3883 domain-containing protein [Oscillospiraceae bacterium]
MYREKLDEIMYSVNNKAISTKILQHMDKIRNNDDEGQARRFVWELIQNAKDVAREDIPLKISMTLDKDRFTFAHNGKDFRLKNLLSLINQVSGKNADDGTTGKFGTGFITTHLLSEKVNVKGILNDFGFEPRNFELLLDRSGHSDEEIIGAVDRAMDSVRCVDDNAAAVYSRDMLNTEFEYALTTDYSRRVAETGMNDACCNLFYCMAFVPQIYEITLVNNVSGTKTVYTRGSLERSDGNISVLTIMENSTEHKVIFASDGEVQVAAEVKDGAALDISSKTSRLFCDFPLIDNQPFPFPTAVNSSSFRVNEPRSCITLTDNPNSTDSELNKRLMKQAVVLFGELLKYLEEKGYKSLYNLINTPKVFKRSDISDSWIRENILAGIAENVFQRRILPGTEGLFAAADTKLILPNAERPELTNELNGLLGGLSEYSVITEDIDSWSAALNSLNSGVFKFLGINDLLVMTDKAADIGNLQNAIKSDVFVWLRQLLDCAVKAEELRNNIYAGNYKLIPTQSGCLKPITEVFSEDTIIDEYYKDICELIDRYVDITSSLSVRSRLISKAYDISGIDGITEYDVSKVGAHIRLGTKSVHTDYYEDAKAVVKLMGACCPDDRIYKTYSCVLDMPERYVPVLKFNNSIWDNTYLALTFTFQSYIYKLAKLSDGFEQLTDACGGVENAIDTINCFHELWDKHCQPSNYYAPVLIEAADGKVIMKNARPYSIDYVINDGIDDRLKDIYRRIVTDGAAIIDKRINVGKNMNIKSMDELNAASLIGNRITAELKDGSIFNKPKDFQLACSLLMRWINANEEKAYELFPAYASREDRMQLMTPEAAAEISDQLDRFNEIIKENGCCSIEDLVQKLSELPKPYDPTADYIDWYGDFGYDPRRNNLDDVLKAIGDAGERFALELLRHQYGENAEIILCNTDSYKQQGYDIIVNSDGETYYYEVKTRTQTSMYRHSLNFSRSQAALFRSKNYRVLLVVLNRNYELSSSVEFSDIFDCFEHGSFTRTDGYRVTV